MPTFIAIDLKSFYASVECVERGLDPLDTNLVVADTTRTSKTICLAVSPSLKAWGISGRPRLFEVEQRVREVNYQRRSRFGGALRGEPAVSDAELRADPSRPLGYLTAPPRMALYIDYSTRVYRRYLNYIAPEDIHVYSVDEVFIDATPYLASLKMSAHDLAMTLVRDVLRHTGVTATAGIGTNLYLSKVAMDIVAKHMEPDADGVRIASLDEASYRRLLWSHTPLTDFWRVGRGISARLAQYGILTMGDLARASLRNEELFYRLFGVNAELLLDHAWGCEPCTMAQVKAYRPSTRSMCSGQVLNRPYPYSQALVVVCEMAEGLALDLLDKGLVTDQLVLDVGYDVTNVASPDFSGPVHIDHYGRTAPKSVHGSANLPAYSCSAMAIRDLAAAILDSTADHNLLIRRLTLTANHLLREDDVAAATAPVQLELFTDYDELNRRLEAEAARAARERRIMQATLALKKKFGKNALLKGLDYQDGATARERNGQIGGHKA